MGGSSYAFLRDHNFRYDGVRLGYVGTVHRRFVTGGLAEFRTITKRRSSQNSMYANFGESQFHDVRE